MATKFLTMEIVMMLMEKEIKIEMVTVMMLKTELQMVMLIVTKMEKMMVMMLTMLM